MFETREQGGDRCLFGRDIAQQALRDAVAVVEGGRVSRVTVLGEPGSGKTVLLEWLVGYAAQRGFQVVAVRPVEGEAELPLAVMTDVARALSGWLDRLGPEHRDVLAAAAGGVGRASTDRLLLGAATLALLAAAAEDRPLLLVVDDAHWVDAVSGEALSFAVRRLMADPVFVVVARRSSTEERIPAQWTALEVDGLTDESVAGLLAEVAGCTPVSSVVTKIRNETRGNPLAVSYLASALPQATLTGAAPLPMILPLQEVTRLTFAKLVSTLPERTRAALTIVAAAGSVAAQLAPLGMKKADFRQADLVAAEDAGVVTGSSGRLEFTHPLYRAAALEVAGPVEVRRAHALLSAVAEGRDPQRHAWHLGMSVVGVDETAASVVAEAADAAERRVGAAASVGLRQLAVALSELGRVRDRRELDAARALASAGHHAEARGHLEAVLRRAGVSAEDRAEAFLQMAKLMLWDTPLDSQPVAERIPEELSPQQLSAVLAVAALRARNAAELRRFDDLAQAAHRTTVSLLADRHPSGGSTGDDVEETVFLLPTLSLVVEAELVGGSHQAPVVHDLVDRVRRLVGAARGGEPLASEIRHALVTLLDDLVGSPVQTLTWTSALDLAGELLALWLSAARARPASMAYLLMARVELCGWTAQMLAGLSAADRAIELSREVGSHVLTGWSHVFASRICAARGDERGCREHGEAGAELGAGLNEPGPRVWATHARGHLLLSTGRADEAFQALAPVADYLESISFRGVRAIPWQPDYIEAAVRSGRPDKAELLLQSWTASMPEKPDSWHRGMVARCRVLTRGDDGLDDLVEAIDRGALSGTPLEEARARLVAGVALRRRRRPGAATAMMHDAAAAFARLGAIGWQQLAATELGDRGRRTSPQDDAAALTSTEMRVAQEIAGGATNREAATRLFCSPKTIEYHLTRIYNKLGIRSRAALASRITPAVVVPDDRPPRSDRAQS